MGSEYRYSVVRWIAKKYKGNAMKYGNDTTFLPFPKKKKINK
jgi:hypothetical protein